MRFGEGAAKLPTATTAACATSESEKPPHRPPAPPEVGTTPHLKRRAYEILEVGLQGDAVARAVNVYILALIVLNVLAAIVETVASVEARYGGILRAFEAVSVAIFTAEYALRLWAITEDPRYGGAVRGRLRFAATPLALIDLLAIAPAYLPMLIGVDLAFMRLLRMFRFLRLLKVARYSRSLRLLGGVFREKREDLTMSLAVILVLLLTSSILMYHVEHDAQPHVFSSIPATMWWGIATLTTVGYGDVVPITPLGRLVGSVIAVLGIGMFALPAGIIANGFSEALENEKRAGRACPTCGRAYPHDADEPGAEAAAGGALSP